jgi:hypothetical protein
MKKLFLITLLAVTSAAPIFATDVPDEEEIKSLTERTLLAWNKGVLKKDFTAFSKNEFASAVQDQLTPEKLLNNFKEAVDKGIDISSAVKEMEPEFKPEPSMSHVGDFEVLTVKGFYDTKPNRLNFQLKYVEDKDEWKLVGIDVVIKPQD